MAANPAIRTTEIDVVARSATADEFEAVFAAGGSTYGGYTKYRERVDGRDIRVFVLEQARTQPAT